MERKSWMKRHGKDANSVLRTSSPGESGAMAQSPGGMSAGGSRVGGREKEDKAAPCPPQVPGHPRCVNLCGSVFSRTSNKRSQAPGFEAG